MSTRRGPSGADASVSWQNTDELVERIAQRVVALLGAAVHETPAPELVSASVVATTLGLSRDYVYAHKHELGGFPLGDGPRPRWLFDLTEARRRLSARSVSERSLEPVSPEPPTLLPRRLRGRKGDGVDLLPIRGDRRAA